MTNLDNEASTFTQKKRLKGAKAREAVEAKEAERARQAMAKPSAEVKKPVEDVQKRNPISPPSGMIMEVVIPMYRNKGFSSTSSPQTSEVNESLPATSVPSSSASPTSDDEASDDSGPRLRSRRKIKPIFISDEEEDTGRDHASDPRTKQLRFKKAAKRKVDSSDYENSASEAESDNTGEDEVLLGSDEEETYKSRSKKATRPAKKAKKGSVSSDVDMDVDEVAEVKKSKAQKKGNKAETKPPKKQQFREATDPWKLKSKNVEKSWTHMHSPPLEMFHFERLVIDEYTYLDGKILTLVQKLTATRRWVLSGTPPIHDFASLKTISAFLNVHLGVDDDGEGQSALVKKRRREQTGRSLIL